ncbi:hypothetical protein HMPREF1039_1257 [Megasphaera lornae]|uniref:Uncharacterized protein n=1 Tax=Megasphaera lornae TaxID=1000568 RepID=D3LWV1_9FIRM|nr:MULTISPECIES: hypothetical protein [Megasphaera]EFD93338.1 hypothetical protein HMPREF0889_0761 [Megasphaera genomosp. type_1 str. 28L]EGL39631.1 hypothetical protein HMPREF1039_1257 [Megasphaera lornae]
MPGSVVDGDNSPAAGMSDRRTVTWLYFGSKEGPGQRQRFMHVKNILL